MPESRPANESASSRRRTATLVGLSILAGLLAMAILVELIWLENRGANLTVVLAVMTGITTLVGPILGWYLNRLDTLDKGKFTNRPAMTLGVTVLVLLLIAVVTALTSPLIIKSKSVKISGPLYKMYNGKTGSISISVHEILKSPLRLQFNVSEEMPGSLYCVPGTQLTVAHNGDDHEIIPGGVLELPLSQSSSPVILQITVRNNDPACSVTVEVTKIDS